MGAANLTAVDLLAQADRELARGIVPAGSLAYQTLKRFIDIVGAIALLIILLPVLLLIAVSIKLTSRGPVLFRQERAGLRGSPFTMIKFRSMRLGAENDREFLSHLNLTNGPVFKIREDPRLTSIGRFLRRSSLDELPQLFNVLKGQMSLVGPRPLWVYEAAQARGAACLRTAVKPGLTCLWQISGRSELSYEQWILLDLFYIQHRGTLLDLLILMQTLPAVLTAHGAY